VATTVEGLEAGAIVTGPLLPEPIEVLATVPMGSALKVIGRGLRTNQVHQPVLDAEQVAQLLVSPKHAPFDGDAQRFRLGIEGHRLGLAYEYDPYFSLSIARIDPLPHQRQCTRPSRGAPRAPSLRECERVDHRPAPQGEPR
jgi:hypothetical protein